MLNRQIIFTLLLLAISIILFNYVDIDIWLQDSFYNFELKKWILDKDNYILKFIFYDGIKAIYVIALMTLLIILLFFSNRERFHGYKPGMSIVFLSMLLVPLIVGALKDVTNTPCPKHIRRYNGNSPYITVLKRHSDSPLQAKRFRCFPAGHASGGFALMSLVFLFKSRKNRILSFIFAMIVAWPIGVYKMLIGDHFLSHTIVSMLVACLIILVITKCANLYFSRTKTVNQNY